VIADRIINENAKAWWTGDYHIPLKGINIGNGWTDPYNQLGNYAKFGYSVGILDDKEAADIAAAEKKGRDLMWWHDWLEARDQFKNVVQGGVAYGGGFDMYNYRHYGGESMSAFEAYFRSDKIKEMLHVPKEVPFVGCSKGAFDALGHDFMMSVKDYLPNVLANIPVMLKNGQDDWIVNTAGAENWIAEFEWDGREGYLKANKTAWHNPDGEIIGYYRRYQNLHQLIINKAGHGTCVDQPAATFQMIESFIEGKPFN
jgi:vitellogenic carboxypeptidase-like protein